MDSKQMIITENSTSSKVNFGVLENAEIILLSQLDASKVKEAIKVRLIKLSKLPSFKKKNATHSMELILMDEEGTKIQATISNTYVIKFEKLFVERACFIIKKFIIGDNLSAYRLTNHVHKLFFDFDTIVMKCNAPIGSPLGLSFTEFDVLHDNALPDDYVVDIIGYVYTYFDMYEHKTKKGQTKKKMNLQLRDIESRSVFVSLWESYAEKMDKFMSKKQEGVTAVIILQCGKFNFSGGRAYVSSSFHGSTLYINDDIEEITAFKDRLVEKESDKSVSSRRLVSSQSVINVEDEFLNNTILNSIEQVNKMAEEKSVIVIGTLISFLPGFEWYYNACKRCNKKVTTEDTMTDELDGSERVERKKTIICPTSECNKNNITISTVPRYKIPLRLQDNTGIVSLTLMDREARKMLKKSSKELLDKILDDDCLSMVPDEIANLVGNKYAFKIDVTSFNITNNYKYFTVTKFTDDPTIIAKLEANLDIHQVDPSDSINVKSNDFGSHDTINFKGTQSCMSDNTPMSRIATTNGIALLDDEESENNITHPELKRKLIEVYEIDDSPKQSATKPLPKSVEGANTTANQSLLIPKKEK